MQLFIILMVMFPFLVYGLVKLDYWLDRRIERQRLRALKKQCDRDVMDLIKQKTLSFPIRRYNGESPRQGAICLSREG